MTWGLIVSRCVTVSAGGALLRGVFWLGLVGSWSGGFGACAVGFLVGWVVLLFVWVCFLSMVFSCCGLGLVVVWVLLCWRLFLGWCLRWFVGLGWVGVFGGWCVGCVRACCVGDIGLVDVFCGVVWVGAGLVVGWVCWLVVGWVL